MIIAHTVLHTQLNRMIAFLLSDCSPQLFLCSGEVFLAVWAYVHLLMASVLPVTRILQAIKCKYMF